MPGGEIQEKQNIEQVIAPLQTADLQQPQNFIEAAFKDKVEDKDLYDKIISVFNAIKTQFPDKDIKTFLSNASISWLIRNVKTKENDNAIQFFS